MESLFFEHLPDLFLVHISSFGYQLSFVWVQIKVKLLMGEFEVSFDWGNVCNSCSSAGFRFIYMNATLKIVHFLAVTLLKNLVLDRRVALRFFADLVVRVF